MNKSNPNVHPQISDAINNLNVDVESELDKYEQSLNNTNLIHQSHNSNFEPSSPNIPVVYQSALIEDDIISVDSRNLSPTAPSLMDKILTPWGVFGILIFIATNIFIAVSLQTFPSLETELKGQNTPEEKPRLENNSSPRNTTPQGNKSPNQPTQSSTNQLNQVTDTNTNKSKKETSSPNSNLTTALLNELNQPVNNISQNVSTSVNSSNIPRNIRTIY